MASRISSWVVFFPKNEATGATNGETRAHSRLQPEFQGGWFVGYNRTEIERCNQKFGREFERVWYLHNIAQGVKLINYYMVYGGELGTFVQWSGGDH
jgi:hypothetical protein